MEGTLHPIVGLLVILGSYGRFKFQAIICMPFFQFMHSLLVLEVALPMHFYRCQSYVKEALYEPCASKEREYDEANSDEHPVLCDE